MPRVTSSVEEVVLAALARGCSHVDAAAAAGVSSKSVQRLLGRPDFASQLAQRRAVRVLDFAARLDEMESIAMEAIRDAMGPGNKTADRLHGVECWSRQRAYVHASFDVEARLRALEGPVDDDDLDPEDTSPVAS